MIIKISLKIFLSREFVYEFTCTNTDISSFNMRQGRRSFPSGHASMSVFQAIFTCWYLQRRFCRNNVNFGVLFIQFLTLSWAIVCSISRITDYRHHWWDVLTGAVLGLIFAVFTVSLCKFLNYNIGNK